MKGSATEKALLRHPRGGMRKNRQPKDGEVRVFAVALSLDTRWAGGFVKFVDVPGGADDGIVCTIPPCDARMVTVKDVVFPLLSAR